LQRAPNYWRAFGLSAARLLLQVERAPPARGTAVNAYRVPGYAAPIHLRTIVSDHETFWQCIVERQYRLDLFPQWPAIERRMAAALARGQTPVIVDGGGNIGLAALWYARALPQAAIVSIEPDAENFALLEKNTAHLGGRVKRVYGAVAPEPMTLRIANPEGGFSAKRVEPATTGLRGYTIDELIALVPNAYPLIVKLDIEGFQARLFGTNTGWVGRVDVITLELDDWQFPWGGTSNAFFRALAAHDFDYLLAQESIVCFRHAKAEGAAAG
jgi:FkbM family methyltransferase